MSTVHEPHAGLDATLRVEREGFDVDLELAIAPGETVALVGPNGAGKSSVVRGLTGLTPISSGVVRLAGRVLDDTAARVFVAPHERRIGTAFQDTLLFPHLDVADNVGFAVAGDGARVANGQTAGVIDWLERVGLAGFGPRRVDELSGGEARRVAIARAMIGGPDLVVLDEPFAGVDVEAHADLRRLLSDGLGDSTAPRLLITHDPADAQALADRMLVLESGRVTQRGTPDEIRQRPATRFVAELAGVNLLSGEAHRGLVRVADELELAIADRALAGDVTVTVRPQAIALHRERPDGSPRNTWSAVVGGVHPVGDLVRVHLDAPVPLIVDVTPGAVADLELGRGRQVWAAVKATSLEVTVISR